MKKIVIVEDDINIMSALRANFSSLGYDVIGFDGSEAIGNIIESIQINVVNFIVLDLILPVVDGFELLREIKTKGEDIKSLVFVFSDVSDEDIKSRCDNIGADYFLLKEDFSPSEFVDKVVKILKNRNI